MQLLRRTGVGSISPTTYHRGAVLKDMFSTNKTVNSD